MKHLRLLWDLLAVSLCLVWAGNTAKGKRLKQKRQLCAFLTLGALHPPRVLSECFSKKKSVFCFNVAWQSCRSVLCLEPLLDTSIDRTMLDWSCREMCCVACIHLGSFSLAPIFHGTLILSHFPLQICPCRSCANWHISIREIVCL